MVADHLIISVWYLVDMGNFLDSVVFVVGIGALCLGFVAYVLLTLWRMTNEIPVFDKYWDVLEDWWQNLLSPGKAKSNNTNRKAKSVKLRVKTGVKEYDEFYEDDEFDDR